MEPITASAARVAGSSLLRLQSDERLATLAALNNDAAFEALVRRYRAPLLRASRKVLFSEAAAEDAVQQAFLRAHQALLRNGPPERFRPWMYTIVINAALAQSAGQAETLPLDEDRVDGVERPDEAHERRERLQSTVGAIQALPPGQRRAIVAREMEGRSHDEIATELGLSRGAARQLIHRARASLRAAATAVTPTGLLERLIAGADSARPVAEATAGGIAGGAGAKLAIAALVAGGVVSGAALSPLDRSEGERATHPAEGASGNGHLIARADAGHGAGGSGAAETESGSGGEDHSGSSNSGPGGGGPDGGDESPGHGESGSGGSGEGSGGSGSSGGSSGSSDEGSGGSGSSGEGSGGFGTDGGDDGVSTSGSSGEGSGSDSSGSSGEGSSGEESSGSGSDVPDLYENLAEDNSGPG